MQHRIVLNIALFLLAFSLQAQSNKMTKRDSFPNAKWEIGLDVLSLFEKNNVPAASIFFRRNYAQSAFRGKAWRFQVGMDTEVRNYTDQTRFFDDTWRIYGPYVGVGHEWQFHQKRFTWSFGVDMTTAYLVSDKYQLVSLTDSTVVDSHMESLRIGMNGLLGAQWTITRNLKVSLESSLHLQYQSFYLDEPDGIYNLPQETWGQTMVTDKKFTTTFQPFWAVRIIYQIQSSHEKS